MRQVAFKYMAHMRCLWSCKNTRWISKNKKSTSSLYCNRNYSTKHVTSSSKKKYAETILLPKTTFPMRIPGNKKTELEIEIQKISSFDSLYSWQRQFVNKPEFVLHDGPPYANGVPHMGHAVNKILKDITIRYKLLIGYRIHYVPGWDCHGLPIELKAVSEDDYSNLTPLKIRKLAREYALSAIKHQKEVFKRWGVMANWDECYHTTDPTYQITQMKAFMELYKKNLVFRDFKPVYWSPSTRTALAEAELEYNPKHESLSVYLKFLLANCPTLIKSHAGQRPIYALIWTTTPWTLPTNECIAYSESIQYSLVECEQSKNIFIIASELCGRLEQILQTQFNNITTFPGVALSGATYLHPIRQEELRFLPGTYVTIEKGTGLVHSSPAHGLDDFNLGLQFGLPVKNILDDKGCFTNECGHEQLIGKSVLNNANETVIGILGENILCKEKYVHSFPYDWRSKQPVIVRPSLQWFINTDSLKEIAVQKLNQIEVQPPSLIKGMIDQLEKRPHWCISRQRVWGLPIPTFYQKPSGKEILNDDLVNHWSNLINQHGIDMWWSLSEEELLPKRLLSKADLPLDCVYEKGSDILDIWFDSGISWKNVLSDTNYEADICLEGVDQSRGWFQSLLLTSVALQGKAPYKKLFFHGFTLDDEGKKMSKSLGNVIDPQIIVDGEKNKKSSALGADTLRWWVASHTGTRHKVHVKNAVLEEDSKIVQKIRGVLRFVLSNLNDFDIHKAAVKMNDMELLDRYMLHLLQEYRLNVTNAYDLMQYDDATNLILNFVVRDISALFLNIIRNRLYCSEPNGIKRRSCQTSLHHLLLQLTFSIAPILPHLAEEIFFHHPHYGGGKQLVFRNTWPECENFCIDAKSKQSVETALQLRSMVNKEATALSTDTEEIDLHIEGNERLTEVLKNLQSEKRTSNSGLCEILQVATVVIDNSNAAIPNPLTNIEGSLTDDETLKFKLVLAKAEHYQCSRCRRYVLSELANEICSECTNVIGNQWA